jgi:hypothetical protein
LTFKYFNFAGTRWRLFHRRGVRTKFDIQEWVRKMATSHLSISWKPWCDNDRSTSFCSVVNSLPCLAIFLADDFCLPKGNKYDENYVVVDILIQKPHTEVGPEWVRKMAMSHLSISCYMSICGININLESKRNELLLSVRVFELKYPRRRSFHHIYFLYVTRQTIWTRSSEVDVTRQIKSWYNL